MYSALKRDGRPLYELARAGRDRSSAPRGAITIDELRAGRARLEPARHRGRSARRAPTSACSRRRFAARLGTLGHLGELRRLWVEPFAADGDGHAGAVEAWTWPEAGAGRRRAWLLPDRPRLPGPAALRLAVPAARCTCARAGCSRRPRAACAAPHVRAYGAQGEFLGLVESHRRPPRARPAAVRGRRRYRRCCCQALESLGILRLKCAAQSKRYIQGFEVIHRCHCPPSARPRSSATSSAAPTDTGSPEVQIALLSARINELGEHFTAHKRDHASRRGLLKLVTQRRKLLDYLKDSDPSRYQDVVARLGLRR